MQKIFSCTAFCLPDCRTKAGSFCPALRFYFYQGKAWLFSGSSGTGKSTHANLWANRYHTPVLNGDLNVLDIKNGLPYLYGLPWCGTSETYTTTTYPLGGIVFLKQAPFNRVNSLPPDEQALFLMQRMISPTWTKDLLLKIWHLQKHLPR